VNTTIVAPSQGPRERQRPVREILSEPLAQHQPRTVSASLHDADTQPCDLADFLQRQILDVSQYHDRAVVFLPAVEGCDQHVSQLELYKLGEPKIHHFCVGVESFAIDSALEKLETDFPESQPLIYRGKELYFRDPDGLLGQVSAVDYRGQRETP
jgi:hypothetical protein